ncbi:MAG: cobalt transporter CbiM [Symploca sp. SIO3C6]|uniref:Cobalt transporter CbiM n=1 Tax=Symploca sp. SIO1C4 TaxID=2607765 RepID=A0A6B3N7E2_9CYAN|nr:cobalt transporter CbiM [Symploca sp. SIO3C6]NER27473.1 cobalt transporter CbiM [Symploca sp. SIO1C4]NET06818.1 cobalt transporter CbiM [Symploca sp. SIO2B6]
MHIPDGILPASVCIAGYAATGGLIWYSLRRIHRSQNSQQNIPKASLLTAAFFIASWIHIPVPPASVHLILNGLLGTILGYYALPAIVIGLFFQAVMFQHGGLSTLGVNAMMMGIPALIAYYLFQIRHFFGRKNRIATVIFAFLGGAGGLGITTLMFIYFVITNIPANIDVEAERIATYGLALAYIPLIAIEGTFTAAVVLFLERVKPELLKDL